MKRCCRCTEVKSIDDFYIDNSRPDGHTYWCKKCHRAWTSSPRSLAVRRAYGKTTHGRRVLFHQRLRRLYKMDLSDFDALVLIQEGRCASCDDHLSQKICVDHCHDSGQVRGLLCDDCNTAEGYLRGRPERARALANYMERNARLVAV